MKKSTPLNICLKATLDVLSGVAFLCFYEDNKAFLVHDYVSGNTPYIDIVDRLHPGDFQKSTLSGRRIDFIYMTEPLFRKVRSAEIIHDGYPTSCRDPRGVTKFCYPSDHYPIIVNLKF